MQSEDYKFTIVKANKTDLDVRKQISEIFAEGFTQWLVFSKDNKIHFSLQEFPFLGLQISDILGNLN